MKRRALLTTLILGATYHQYTKPQIQAQTDESDSIRIPDIPNAVSGSEKILIPILPFNIRGRNLDDSSDVKISYRLIQASDSSKLAEVNRSVDVVEGRVVSISAPKINLQASGSKFEKTGTDLKIEVTIDHSSINSGVKTQSEDFAIVRSTADSILIVPENERITEYDESYEITKWENNGSLAMEKGDSLSISK